MPLFGITTRATPFLSSSMASTFQGPHQHIKHTQTLKHLTWQTHHEFPHTLTPEHPETRSPAAPPGPPSPSCPESSPFARGKQLEPRPRAITMHTLYTSSENKHPTVSTQLHSLPHTTRHTSPPLPRRPRAPPHRCPT